MARSLFYCLLSIFCLILSSHSVLCQNKITDSLEIVLASTAQGQKLEHLKTLDRLFDEYCIQRNLEKAKFYAYSLIKKAKKYENKRYTLKGELNEAWTLLNVENAEVAFMKVEDVLEEAIKLGDQLLEADCYLFLGYYTRYYKHQFDCFYFTRAKDLFTKLNSTKEINAWYFVSICQNSRVGLELTLEEFKAIKIRTDKTNQPYLRLLALDGLLYAYFNLNQLDEIPEIAEEALKIALEYGYSGKELVRIYSMISSVHFRNKDLDEGIRYAELAYDVGMNSSDIIAQTKGMIRLASLYTKYVPEKYDEAEKLFLQVIELSIKHKIFFRYAYGTFNYGELLKAKGDSDEAIKKYIECIEFNDTSRYKNTNLDANAKSKLFELLNKFKNSEELQDLENYFLSKSTDGLGLQSSELIYEIRKIIAIKNDDYKQALKWQELVHDVKLRLKQDLHDNDLKQVHLKSQLENERKVNTKNQELIERKNTNNTLLLIASLLLFVLFIFQLLRLRNKKTFNEKILQKNEEISNAMDQISNLNASLKDKNEKLEQKNEIKNKELLDFAMFKATHDDQMRKIRDIFVSISKKSKVDLVDLKLIESKLESLLTTEEEHWISFRQKIEDSFPDFFTNLSIKHPELSKKDQFHCGYVLIGMSVKGAAKASFVTIATVNSTRYRIKKKLGLSKSDNLKGYLVEISQQATKVD